MPRAHREHEAEPLLEPQPLVDREWEIHDAKLADARMREIRRRLPSLLWQGARLAWEASPRHTVTTVTCDLVSGALTAVNLLGVNQVLIALLEGGPTTSRLLEALPALLFIAAVNLVRMALGLVASWSESRLTPYVDQLVERRLYETTTR